MFLYGNWCEVVMNNSWDSWDRQCVLWQLMLDLLGIPGIQGVCLRSFLGQKPSGFCWVLGGCNSLDPWGVTFLGSKFDGRICKWVRFSTEKNLMNFRWGFLG